MAKSTYLSNSAKILSVLAGMLLLSNILITVGAFTENYEFSYWATTFSNLCLYVVLIMGYIAFNGEAVGHKRNHNRKRKRILGFFKLLLFFCFAFSLLRGVFETGLRALPVDSVKGIIARLVMSILATVGSYGFLFGALSFWYVIRDKGNLKLMLPELVSLFISICYNGIKFIDYVADRYKIIEFGKGFTALLSDGDILRVLCAFQYMLNLIMLVSVTVYYGKKGDEEQKVLDKNVKTLAKARNIIKEDGYGIDTLEDDFLMSE